ncbi:hypothetical protein F0562_001436 [Nyssa sinensis]|uniref:Uncharacterized protein n=1 Tax=Nyssa sinensis TaxID=561372 RepID=A0A5J5C3K3_9ASTE|nr:hypothetical protein F0562_001436 [Nyssa sinensis]
MNFKFNDNSHMQRLISSFLKIDSLAVLSPFTIRGCSSPHFDDGGLSFSTCVAVTLDAGDCKRRSLPFLHDRRTARLTVAGFAKLGFDADTPQFLNLLH